MVLTLILSLFLDRSIDRRITLQNCEKKSHFLCSICRVTTDNKTQPRSMSERVWHLNFILVQTKFSFYSLTSFVFFYVVARVIFFFFYLPFFSFLVMKLSIFFPLMSGQNLLSLFYSSYVFLFIYRNIIIDLFLYASVLD